MSFSNIFWIYTHNFTNTGAPLVLADIVRELAEKGMQTQLRLISWGGKHDQRHSNLHKELSAEGFSCEILELGELPPTPKFNDRILLNSLAVPDDVVNLAQTWLQQGRISRLDWFAHEANPEVWLPHSAQTQRLKLLLENENVCLRVPSQLILKRYQHWLDYFGKNLERQIPKLSLDKKTEVLFNSQIPSFDTLHFQLTAMAGAGQKGHLWLLRVLEQALAKSDAQQKHLRPIELSFIGLEQGPYAAFTREVIRRGQKLLGDSFHWTHHGAKSDALSAMAKANVAVSCSLDETFSLVSAESMALGQPLLRSQTGGWSEQLDDGINGFDLGLSGPEVRFEHVELISKLRDPNIVSNSQLERMSKSARQRASEFLSINYVDWLLCQ